MPVFSKHAFLTHDWGDFNSKGEGNEDGVQVFNHDRVSRIYQGLSIKGLKCWFDEVEMEGMITDKMCKGIDDSAVVVVFLTKRYLIKVQGENQKDNCKKEFNYSDQTKGGQFMVGVVMEPEMGDASKWRGPVSMVLGGQLYIDFSNDDIWQPGSETRFEAKLLELHKRIESIISAAADVSVSAALSLSALSDATTAAASAGTDELSEELISLLVACRIEKYSDKFLDNLILDAKDVTDLSIAELKDFLGLPLLPAKKLFVAATELVEKKARGAKESTRSRQEEKANHSRQEEKSIRSKPSTSASAPTPARAEKMKDAKLIRSDADIHEAAKLWCTDPSAAERRFGHISDWDTSSVTSMKELFEEAKDFTGVNCGDPLQAFIKVFKREATVPLNLSTGVQFQAEETVSIIGEAGLEDMDKPTRDRFDEARFAVADVIRISEHAEIYPVQLGAYKSVFYKHADCINGRKVDYVGIAKTGEGKTLAFFLPILANVDPKLAKTQAIILVPTELLAAQEATIMKEFVEQFSSKLNDDDTPVYPNLQNLRVVKLVRDTGTGINRSATKETNAQRKTLGYKHPNGAPMEIPHIVIGTPHVVKKFLDTEAYPKSLIDARDVKVLVLDEADYLLNEAELTKRSETGAMLEDPKDMASAVKAIARKVREKRTPKKDTCQFLLFSATWNDDMDKLIRNPNSCFGKSNVWAKI